ncbi:SMI1/KNR4 family protein [Thauera sinica]|uniref:SMI1/KNR4 family protein n=1 Tax=Thauera sinica TaxID=2665146 RepID=A0ABW1ANP8_9RHOO|nr:SMI1/KNR4 family protein [Thauera sp. K11]ATE61145.1 hypothetical protein CCZ27_15430 [Thauera sp. K11]
MNLLHAGPSLSEADIDAFEHEIGFALPSEYRRFLLIHNGGTPETYPAVFWMCVESELKRYFEGESSANKASGLVKTPEGYIWHHVENGEKLQLVPYDVHLITGRHSAISRFHQSNAKGNLYAQMHRVKELREPGHRNVKEVTDTVHSFFQLIEKLDPRSILWNYRVLANRIPSDFLPIACDGSGSVICLALSGKDFGSVYLWDWYAEQVPPNYRNVHFVAESFEGLINDLDSEVRRFYN